MDSSKIVESSLKRQESRKYPSSASENSSISSLHTGHSFHKINPGDFITYLPWACQQMNVNVRLNINKVPQSEYVSALDKTKSIAKSKILKKTSSTLNIDSAPNLFSSPVDIAEIVYLLVSFSGDNLVHIKIEKTQRIPREVIAIMGLIFKFYPLLYGLTINSGADKYTIHEICKSLPTCNITELNFDNTCIPEGNYDTILDNSHILKALSLSRCSLPDSVVEKITSKLVSPHPVSSSLSVLILSSNRITDKSGKAIAKMLRSNRCLSYLNLADNSITDVGVEAILNVLLKFPLTVEEILSIRSNRINYLKERQKLIDNYMLHYRELDEIKKKNKGVSVRKGIVVEETTSYEKAASMAESICGKYHHPLSTGTFAADGILYSSGNNTLAYLNIAYTSISIFSIKLLLKVLHHQKIVLRQPKGLINVCIEGNPLPMDAKEVFEIDKLLFTSLCGRRGSVLPKKLTKLGKKI